MKIETAATESENARALLEKPGWWVEGRNLWHAPTCHVLPLNDCPCSLDAPDYTHMGVLFDDSDGWAMDRGRRWVDTQRPWEVASLRYQSRLDGDEVTCRGYGTTRTLARQAAWLAALESDEGPKT